MEEALLDIKNRCEKGIVLMKKTMENNKTSNIVINRCSYQINTLECFLEIAKKGLESKSAVQKKADQWDKLDEKIGKFYESDTGDIEEGDLGDIGELAASAFGYL